MRGARSIYVDYVDYDEIAHHAGGTRIESLAALDGPRPGAGRPGDGGRSGRRAATTSSLLSDHGQSQGEPFASRYGIELSELCRSLTQSRDDRRSRAASRAGAGSTRCWRTSSATAAARACRRRPRGASDNRMKPERPEAEARADRARQRQPRAGLRARPASGSRSRRSRRGGPRWSPGSPRTRASASSRPWASDGPVAIGRAGRHHLATGVVEGVDPLAHVRRRTRRAMLLTADADGPRRRTSTSTAPSTPTRSTWPPSSRWSAATVGSAAGRTAASCSPRPTCSRPTEPDRRRRRAAPAPRRHPRVAGAPDPPADVDDLSGPAARRGRTSPAMERGRPGGSGPTVGPGRRGRPQHDHTGRPHPADGHGIGGSCGGRHRREWDRSTTWSWSSPAAG